MNNDAVPKVIMAIIIVIIAVVLSRFLPSKPDPEEQRRRDLAALAKKLKLHFSPKSDFELAKNYSFLRWLRRGDISYAYNVFYGNHLGFPVTVFDYTFAAGQYNYYWSAFVLKMKTNFPDMIISHEKIGIPASRRNWANHTSPLNRRNFRTHSAFVLRTKNLPTTCAIPR